MGKKPPAGWQIWWLRNSGRYLAPTGAGDYLYAVALAIRGVSAIQYVVGSSLLMAAVLFIAIDRALGAILQSTTGIPDFAVPGIAILAAGVAMLFAWVLPSGIAYFAIETPKPDAADRGRAFWLRSTWLIFLGSGLASLGIVVALRDWLDPAVAGVAGAMGFEFAAGAAFVPAAVIRVQQGSSVHRAEDGDSTPQSQVLSARVLMTRWLSAALKTTLMTFAVGLLLLGTFLLVKLGPSSLWAQLLAYGGGGGSVLVMIVKQAAGAVTRRKGAGAAPGFFTVDRVALALAFVFVLILLVVWFSFAWGALNHLESLHVLVSPLLVLFLAVLVIGLVTGRSFAFLNLTTIQALYASRLTRAFLGASNPKRSDIGASRWSSISDTHPKDNLTLDDYYGAAGFAPQHIVNATLNETVSPVAPLVQRDRHGRPVALTPAHYGIDGQWHLRAGLEGADVPEVMPIGSWIAISGAAFSTGAGRGTSLGKALLLGLSDVRLGYWWNAGRLAAPASDGLHRLRRWITLRFQTQAYLLAELLARYRGACAPYWFLSDGGHFENTAIYELLRRRVGLIVATDSGADPNYEQDDVANMMRLTRIDFGCEFIRIDEERVAQSTGVLRTLSGCVWSRERPNRGDGSDRQCMSLYWVYRGTDSREALESGLGGSALIVLKPRIVADAPADVRQYAFANQEFPQQSTADQFFDEQQWESYRKLGELIGALLSADQGGGPPEAMARCLELRRQMHAAAKPLSRAAGH
jgi:hypothetical protein